MPMTENLARVLLPAAIAASCLLPPASHAQWQPAKPMRIIVPFPPGGGTDKLARMVAARLSTTLGQTVVVDNRPGAGGVVGTEMVAKSPPDGHTMLIASPSIIVSPLLIKNLPYDPMKDFASVAFMATFPTALVVGAQVKAVSVGELIDLAKAAPGKLN